MEEDKKKGKFNVTALLLCIALVVICIMGIYIYQLSVEKAIVTRRAESLNTQIANLEGRSKYLEGVLDQISSLVDEAMGRAEKDSGDSVAEKAESGETGRKAVSGEEASHIGVISGEESGE